MTDYTELKRLASASKNWGGEVCEGRWYAVECFKRPYFSAQDAEFIAACDPGRVLALIAENESAHKHWQNESNNVQVLVAEVARLKAENEALRREREGKVICDLELFETLRDSANTEADEHRQCMATYRPLRQANLDSVVKKCDDLLAAMGKGEPS